MASVATSTSPRRGEEAARWIGATLIARGDGWLGGLGGGAIPTPRFGFPAACGRGGGRIGSASAVFSSRCVFRPRFVPADSRHPGRGRGARGADARGVRRQPLRRICSDAGGGGAGRRGDPPGRSRALPV